MRLVKDEFFWIMQQVIVLKRSLSPASGLPLLEYIRTGFLSLFVLEKKKTGETLKKIIWCIDLFLVVLRK